MNKNTTSSVRVVLTTTGVLLLLYVILAAASLIIADPRDDLKTYLTLSFFITFLIIMLQAYFLHQRLEASQVGRMLEQLDERKSQFLSVVAHQLRTPLSGIKWTLTMMLNGDLGVITPDQKDFLTKSSESNQRMISLVNDMLGADRASSGNMQFVFKAAQLTPIIKEVFRDLEPFARTKHITIYLTFEDQQFPDVQVDVNTIRQVFQNLIENAIKYTNQHGEVKISIKDIGEALEIAITDNGIGIPADQQKNIFTRFYRANNAIQLETDGSGLGLFIVKEIVDKHGGAIRFESEEGKGTTFFITIPKLHK